MLRVYVFKVKSLAKINATAAVHVIHAWIIPDGQLIGAIPRDHARFITCLNGGCFFWYQPNQEKKETSLLKTTLSSIIATSQL